MANVEAKSTAKEKEHTTANFQFPKENKVQPAGFEGLNISGDVTVTVKGKVTSIRQNENEWDHGKSIAMNITSCEITVPAKQVTLSEAIEAGKKTV